MHKTEVSNSVQAQCRQGQEALSRIRRMTLQFDVALLQIIDNN
jgi:hypothetical protein